MGTEPGLDPGTPAQGLGIGSGGLTGLSNTHPEMVSSDRRVTINSKTASPLHLQLFQVQVNSIKIGKKMVLNTYRLFSLSLLPNII